MTKESYKLSNGSLDVAPAVARRKLIARKQRSYSSNESHKRGLMAEHGFFSEGKSFRERNSLRSEEQDGGLAAESSDVAFEAPRSLFFRTASGHFGQAKVGGSEEDEAAHPEIRQIIDSCERLHQLLNGFVTYLEGSHLRAKDQDGAGSDSVSERSISAFVREPSCSNDRFRDIAEEIGTPVSSTASVSIGMGDLRQDSHAPSSIGGEPLQRLVHEAQWIRSCIDSADDIRDHAQHLLEQRKMADRNRRNKRFYFAISQTRRAHNTIRSVLIPWNKMARQRGLALSLCAEKVKCKTRTLQGRVTAWWAALTEGARQVRAARVNCVGLHECGHARTLLSVSWYGWCRTAGLLPNTHARRLASILTTVTSRWRGRILCSAMLHAWKMVACLRFAFRRLLPQLHFSWAQSRFPLAARPLLDHSDALPFCISNPPSMAETCAETRESPLKEHDHHDDKSPPFDTLASKRMESIAGAVARSLEAFETPVSTLGHAVHRPHSSGWRKPGSATWGWKGSRSEGSGKLSAQTDQSPLDSVAGIHALVWISFQRVLRGYRRMLLAAVTVTNSRPHP